MSRAELFTSLQLRQTQLHNRIVMSPMTRGFCLGGVPGPDVAAYYERRAQGDVGLIITEGVGIDHPSALGSAGLDETNLPHLFGAAALEGWREVTRRVHGAGGAIFPQLWHQGPMRAAGTGPFPRARSCRPSGIWGPPQGSTVLPADYVRDLSGVTEPMSESQIADVISAYARSARHAQQVGFDGIALHGAHGYLIDTFLWSVTNKRTDRWGGAHRQRSLFASEVVRAIRAQVGDRLPIVFRFSQFKQQDFNAKLAESPAELEAVLGPIADAGADVFDASVRYFNRPAFDGSELSLAGWARKVTGRFSIAVGGIGMDRGFGGAAATVAAAPVDNLAPLLQRFRTGEFDLIGVGRALLNDAHWARRLRTGEAFQPFDPEALQELR